MTLTFAQLHRVVPMEGAVREALVKGGVAALAFGAPPTDVAEASSGLKVANAPTRTIRVRTVT